MRRNTSNTTGKRRGRPPGSKNKVKTSMFLHPPQMNQLTSLSSIASKRFEKSEFKGLSLAGNPNRQFTFEMDAPSNGGDGN
mmetsp:Transcript_21803/g.26888  ORF Transcript_21803/g.26888 Transcript_21803/m.26888 type:complete len:81 (-) Transcript_21803:446-688(-)